MKRILVICPHPEGVAPGQRLKYEQYFDDWRAHGYEVVVSPFMSDRLQSIVYRRGRVLEKAFWVAVGYLRRVRDLFRLPYYDGAYVFLWVTPFGPPIFERLVRWAAKRMLYDIDDLVFLGHSSAANRWIEVLKGRRKMLYLMGAAEHVIVCTPHLDDFVRQYNRRTTDISSTIDTERYRPSNPYSNEGDLTLGWSGSHSTAPYLHLLDDVLRELSEEVGVRLRVIGDPAFDIEGVEVEAMAWSEPTEVGDLSAIDIGLYPLPDEEWVLGKSGLKALQYMALGIPVVATDIGAARRIIEHGTNGFLVGTDEEWVRTIRRLAEDPELRRRVGEAGRRTVEERFSVRGTAPAYRNVLGAVFASE